MNLLEELISPLTLEKFKQNYLYSSPFAVPNGARKWEKLSPWDILRTITNSKHKDCWLPEKGKLPDTPSLSNGSLSFEQSLMAFEEGRTILVRHAEKAHPLLKDISESFFEIFKDPVDIQLYFTPTAQEGFGWHFDLEEVFVLQVAGEKEFWLLQNSDPAPRSSDPSLAKDLRRQSKGSVISCHLKAGDFLYIPAGYWHKAKAITTSFHMSIGVMSSTAYGRN